MDLFDGPSFRSPIRGRLFWFMLGSGATVATYFYMRPRINMRERVDRWRAEREARRAERAERGESKAGLSVSASDAFNAAKAAWAYRREAKAERAAAKAADQQAGEPEQKTALPPPRSRILALLKKDKKKPDESDEQPEDRLVNHTPEVVETVRHIYYSVGQPSL